MKTRIYNKTKFNSGILFLLVALFSGIATFLNASNMDMIKISLRIIFIIVSLSFAGTEIYRSLNKECTKKDLQENDEREQMLNIKSKSAAFTATFTICFIIIAAMIIILALTRNIIFMGMLIGIGLVPLIMVITEIAGYLYHDSRN